MDEGDKILPMGTNATYEHFFTTIEGQDFEEEIKFTYQRPWLLHEFP